MNLQGLKATPLLAMHQKDGGKLVSFAGWQMPVEYKGILEEHRAVRGSKGLFDLSHMGEIQISGADAFPFLQNLITNDLDSLANGQALYTVMCKEDGGILDDMVVYNLEEKYLLVVNASNTEKILNWMGDRKSSGSRVQIENKTDETALLAVQGPFSEPFLQQISSMDLSSLRYYHSSYSEVASIPCLLSRTGYTGEDGFEIYVEADHAAKLWEVLREKGIEPVGLGARDTLRLEAAYLLYGNDMDETTSPLETGLSWIVKFHKPNFIGKEALAKQKEKGISRKLIAFVMQDRSVPRKDYRLFLEGENIGWVTSGTFSPTLGKGIGLGTVQTAPAKAKQTKEGTQIQVGIRGEKHPAVVSKKPFIKGSVKNDT